MTVRDLLKTSVNVFNSRTACMIRSRTGSPLEYACSDYIINSPYGNRNVNNWFIKSFDKNINVINEIEIEVADV